MIRRTFACTDCDFEWTVFCDYEDPLPDCPVCAHASRWQPMPVAIGTNKGKAVDYTQRMVEETMGLTNFRDNQRPGDIAAMGPEPMQTAESERLTREAVEMARGLGGVEQPPLPPALQQQVESFWGGGVNPNMAQVDMGAARASSSAAASEGVDALSILGNAKERGMNYDVVGAAPLKL